MKYDFNVLHTAAQNFMKTVSLIRQLDCGFLCRMEIHHWTVAILVKSWDSATRN